MKKTLSVKQMTYSVALFIIASNMLTKSLYMYTKNQTWVSVFVATAVSVVIISIYGRLVKDHPGGSLFDINEAVFGRFAGKIISAAYLFFFLTLTVFNTQDLGSFVHAFVLSSTPLNMIYAAFLIVCAYAVRKGADKMTQYSAFILIIYVTLVVILSCLLIPKMQLVNFLPIFTIPVKNVLLSAHTLTMLPYSEILVFLMMAQFVSKPEEVGGALRRGLLIGAAVTLFLIVRDIAVMGDYTRYASSPTFSTIRLIDVGDILTRLEIINAAFLVILLFFKVSILLFALTVGIGLLFNISRYKIFTLIACVLTIVCGNVFFASTSEHQLWFRVAATYSTFFLLVLPSVTLIVSRFRKSASAKAQENTVGQQ